MRLPEWLRGRWGVPAALGALWIAAWGAALLAGAAGAADWISRWSWPLLQGYALAACLRIAFDGGAPPRIRRAWAVLGGAVGLALIGDGIWAVISLDKEPPFPSIADPFYLASYPVQLVGQLMLPAAPARPGERPRIGMDLATVAVAASVGVYEGFLRPLAAAYGANTLGLVFAAGPVVGDLVLLAGVTVVILRRPDASTAGAVLILSAAILVYAISDFVYVSQSFTGAYRTGSAVDLGWMAGPLLIALSALRQRWGAGDYAQVERTATLLERAGVALPIGAAGFGFFLILEVVARDARGSLLTVAGAAALCAIVLARQIYTAAQNERLATDLQTRYRQLEALAALDPLTQISNRGAFESYLAHAWERAARDRTPLALLMCDIDYFKRINDAAGHLAGDDCLRRVAWVVRDQARRRGALAARYGGEEFAVVLPGARLEDARVAAKKVARGLKRAKLPHPDSPFGKVTLSIGVAWVTPGATGAPRELVDAADKALYRAKSNGRNQVVAA